jgi:hypothetical protein
MATNGQHPKAVDWASMPDWITAEEAAELSGYHVNYIRRLMRAHKVNGRKAGLMWWVDRDSMRAYLAKVQELGPQKFTPHSIAKDKDNE